MDRYVVEHKIEQNVLDKPTDMWYVKDLQIGKHGKYVGRIYEEKLAIMACDYWNGKKKLTKARKRKILR